MCDTWCTWWVDVHAHGIVTCVHMVGRCVCTWYSNVCAHGGWTCVHMV